jgi:hypothetical protein
MNPEVARTAFDNAVAHAPVVALLTFYFVGFALMGLLIMFAILLLLHDLAEGIRRWRRRRS